MSELDKAALDAAYHCEISNILRVMVVNSIVENQDESAAKARMSVRRLKKCRADLEDILSGEETK